MVIWALPRRDRDSIRSGVEKWEALCELASEEHDLLPNRFLFVEGWNTERNAKALPFLLIHEIAQIAKIGVMVRMLLEPLI